MSIFEVAKRFAIKLGTEPGGYFRKNPDYDPPELEPAPEPAKLKRRDRKIVPYQPTDEELNPKDPWAPEAYEEIAPGEPYAADQGTGKTKIKGLTDEALLGLSDKEFTSWMQQQPEVKDSKEEKSHDIKRRAIETFIFAEAGRQGLLEMPDLISLAVDGDKELFFYDKNETKIKPIKVRMKLTVSQKDLTNEIKRLMDMENE